ncbi:DUF4365 domain-containing protein [Nocardioides dubius]
MPQRRPSARVGSAGVTHTALAVQDELGWLFREQPTEDFGIDAHTEVVDADNVTGRLLALQIKSGQSWFREATLGGWWYRPDKDHVAYWLDHSLPVAVVLYDDVKKTCFWQLISRDTLQQTKTGGWKVLVPNTQVLDRTASGPLKAAADGDPYELRLRELRLAKPWMDMLARGTRLVVDFEEWVNKSSGRGKIAIGIDHEDGKDPEQLVAWNFFIGLRMYADVVPLMFAWADCSLHEETYEQADLENYEDECMFWDEGDRFYRESFEDWSAATRGERIRPYANGAGEVDFFRVELTLNELGKAFLIVDNFANTKVRQFTTS